MNVGPYPDARFSEYLNVINASSKVNDHTAKIRYERIMKETRVMRHAVAESFDICNKIEVINYLGALIAYTRVIITGLWFPFDVFFQNRRKGGC